MNNYFPELLDSFLEGQDLLYTQFNEVSFYIEDTDQENLYFNVLKKLFPGVAIEKIFPLNGKKNVLDNCRNNINKKDKIYIVDLDFDDILEKKEVLPNLFYLNAYSIENLLISKQAIFEIIKEKSPRLKDFQIEASFDFDNYLRKIDFLVELAISFIIIQNLSLGKEYFSICTFRDFDFNQNDYKSIEIKNYFSEIKLLISQKDGRLTFNGQLNKYKKHYNNLTNKLKNIPGKYILILLNDLLKSNHLINQFTLESFTYKLAKDVDISKFDFLKSKINDYRLSSMLK